MWSDDHGPRHGQDVHVTVQVDHVVALTVAWDAGARGWPNDRRQAFGNDLLDPRSLRAVTGSVNHDKSDQDPSHWLPPHEAFVCEYLADWISITARWGLSMDQSEHRRIRNLLGDRCPDQTITPWPDTPPPAPPTEPVTTEPPPALDSGDGDSSCPDVCIPRVSVAGDLDCGDIEFRRFTVLSPDPHGFDGNNDGVGCESETLCVRSPATGGRATARPVERRADR